MSNSPQRVYKTFGLPVVHTFEVVLIYTFCSSGTVDNVIELTIQFLMTGKLRTKLTGMRKVEFKKMYLLVPNTPGCWTNGCLPIRRIPASTPLPR